jgi:hypothetical protein
LPLGDGTVYDEVDSLGFAPRFSACGAGVLLLDDEPERTESGSRPRLCRGAQTRTHKRPSAATCFRDRLLIRPDHFHNSAPQKVPGVGIEPTTSWFRARRHYQQQLPRITFTPQANLHARKFGEKDLNLHHLVQSQAAYR